MFQQMVAANLQLPLVTLKGIAPSVDNGTIIPVENVPSTKAKVAKTLVSHTCRRLHGSGR